MHIRISVRKYAHVCGVSHCQVEQHVGPTTYTDGASCGSTNVCTHMQKYYKLSCGYLFDRFVYEDNVLMAVAWSLQ